MLEPSRCRPRARPSAGARAALFAASAALDLAYVLALPVLLIVLLVLSRGLTRPKYRRGLLGKLAGFPRREGDRPATWVHAVSVGEVLVAEPFVRELERRFPDQETVITVSTSTGLEVAQRRFPGRTISWFPLDVSPSVVAALRRLRPAVVVLLELEVWPNFLLHARRRGVPVIVANGRLTERSARRYRRLGPLARGLFGGVSAYGVQNEEYAERFRTVGAPPEKISVLGNMKHDRSPPPGSLDGEELRRRLSWDGDGGCRPLVLVAGCTHPGEEAVLGELLPRWRQEGLDLRLVLAPRHVERLAAPGEVERWRLPLPVVRWSEVGRSRRPPGERVLIVDTVGELERFYAAADLVFVGGTLVPHGGHNLLEPARLGKATLFGPHHANFEDEAAHLLRHGAAARVEGRLQLAEAAARYLRDAEARQELGARAREAAARLQGAVERHIDWMAEELQLLCDSRSC